MAFKTVGEAIQKYLGEQTPQEKEELNFKSVGEIRRHFEKEFDGLIPNQNEWFVGIGEVFLMAQRRTEKDLKEAKRLQVIEDAKKMWSFKEMKDQALRIGKEIGKREKFEFFLGLEEEKVFNMLCLYFINDPKFETFGLEIDGQITQKYSLNKGIWLQSGIRGVGKSVMLRCFQWNKRQCFRYCNMTELRQVYQKNGYEAVEHFVNMQEVYPSTLNYYQNEAGWLHDEMFTESVANHMGTKEVISEFVVNSMYDFQKNYKGNFWKNHCTSNISGKEIEEKNGLNYRSRMREMYNFIKLPGESKR